jgi:hypothetical protein
MSAKKYHVFLTEVERNDDCHEGQCCVQETASIV